MYEMEYKGGLLESDLSLIPFEEEHYEKYKNLIDECYYEMRKALDINPHDKYCDTLEELIKQKENIFLLFDNDELICSVSCFKNLIENVAVNLKYQRKGYGKKVVEFAISYMQKRGDSPIKLTVTKWNKNAIRLYEKLGFEIIKEVTLEAINRRDDFGNWTFEFISTRGLDVH